MRAHANMDYRIIITLCTHTGSEGHDDVTKDWSKSKSVSELEVGAEVLRNKLLQALV